MPAKRSQVAVRRNVAVATPQAIAPQGEVQTQLDALEANISFLSSVVAELGDRLQPVTHGGGLPDASDTKQMRQAFTPIGNRIEDAAGAVLQLNDTLRTLLTNLAI